MVFVVLREHVDAHQIDAAIHAHYPDARIVVLPQTTAGAAETAGCGLAALDADLPVAINDCDHAFDGNGLGDSIAALRAGAAGLLVGFASQNPAYSYVRFDVGGAVTGTVEKQPVSRSAIAGCYFFDRPRTFLDQLATYRAECPYPELFVSGVYNALIRDGQAVLYHELRRHLSFGTPDEAALLKPADFGFLGCEV